MSKRKRFNLVLSEREKVILQELADLDGEVSLANIVRKLIFQASKSKKIPENEKKDKE